MKNERLQERRIKILEKEIQELKELLKEGLSNMDKQVYYDSDWYIKVEQILKQ